MVYRGHRSQSRTGYKSNSLRVMTLLMFVVIKSVYNDVVDANARCNFAVDDPVLTSNMWLVNLYFTNLITRFPRMIYI